MSSPAINTVIKMMESLSEDKQNKLVEHLQEYIQDLQEEAKWQDSFNRTQDKLVAAATKLCFVQIENLEESKILSQTTNCSRQSRANGLR